MEEEGVLLTKFIKKENNDVFNNKLVCENYGELYCLEKTGQGEWMDKIIKLIAGLKCIFGGNTPELPNGISVTKRDVHGVLIGTILSSFLLRTYIIKVYKKYVDDNQDLSYLSPINLILDAYNSYEDYGIQIINSIETILNHPHFSNCKSIDDICKKIIDIKHLNRRFER